MIRSMSLRLGALFASAVLPAAFAQNYTTFDPPGSTGTYPASINSLGDVTGYYLDSSGVDHGFLRTANGTITTFDPPGSTATLPNAISSSDEIVGSATINGVAQGFLRTSDGTITMINNPNLVAPVPTSINSYGDIAGLARSPGALGVPINFILTSGGTLTTYDVTYTDNCGGYFVSINDAGDVAGTECGQPDAVALPIGYVKPNGGAITTFGVPLELDVSASGINDSGTIVGYASDRLCGFFGSCVGTRILVGFVRTLDGAATSFRVQGSETVPTGINASGEITGSYSSLRSFHGFSRDAGGVITTIDPPGSAGTVATSINDSGAITGSYASKDSLLSHGFIMTP